MERIRNNDQFVAKVNELVGEEYSVLSPYIKSSEHLLMKHNYDRCDNYEYLVSPNKFLRGRRCPKCAERQKTERITSNKKTHEEFAKEFKEAVGDKYILLSEYTGERTGIKVRHVACNTEDTVSVRYFIKNGGSCKKCSSKSIGEKNKKNHEHFVAQVRDLVGSEYTIVGTYKSSKTEIEIKHNTCGETWLPTPNNFLRGSRCDHCFGKHTKTTEEFKNDVFQKVGNEYTVLGRYDRSHGKIEMKHNDCGHIWSPRPSDFLYNKSRCPLCSIKDSKGAQRIASFLDSTGIDYIREYRLPECRNIKPLPFDFKLMVNDSFVLVEYDGEQHFMANEAWGGEKSLKETQLRDKIKTEYCIKNNINLLRIDYTQFNQIETILEEALGLVQVTA